MFTYISVVALCNLYLKIYPHMRHIYFRNVRETYSKETISERLVNID